MRHLTIDVSNYDSRLHIGKQGENLTREITFDCAAWLDDLSGGVLSIVHQRPTDPDAYPCADYVTTDTSLTWSINETDVAFSGLGKCELRYTIGSRIAKTKTFYTEIVNALNPLDTPPEAYEPYIDRVIDAARQEMENMTVSASATEGEEASASVTKETTDHVNLDFEFVLQKGEAGDNGMSVREVTATYTEDGGEPDVDVFTEWPYPQPDHPYQDLEFRFKNLKGDKGDKGDPGQSFDTSYLPSDTASGSPATFPDGAKNVAVDELVTTIVPQQDLHGYDKPWAAGAGKNICPNIFTSQTINNIIVTVNSDGTIHCKGTASGLVAFNITNNDNPVKMKAGNTYVLSGCPQGGVYGAYDLRLTNTPTGATNVATDYGTGATYAATADVDGGVRVVIYSGQVVDFTYKPMVRLSDTSADFEPYSNICPIGGWTQAEITHNGDTDTIPFGQTVYGGSLNVTTGVLTLDTAYVTLNGTEANNTYAFTAGTGVNRITYVPYQNEGKIGSQFFYSNIAKASGLYSANPNEWEISNSAATVARCFIGVPTTITSVGDWKTFLTSNNMQLCYKMATSQTVQLTPVEVDTILGANSISSDCGVVSVKYRADIGLYIDKKLGA